MLKKTATAIVLIAALAVTAQAAMAARADTMKPQLVRTIMDKKLGEVLTKGRQAGDLRLEPRAKGHDQAARARAPRRGRR